MAHGRLVLAGCVVALVLASAATASLPFAPRYTARFVAMVNEVSARTHTTSKIIAASCVGPSKAQLYACSTINLYAVKHSVWCSQWIATSALKIEDEGEQRCPMGALTIVLRHDRRAHYALHFSPLGR